MIYVAGGVESTTQRDAALAVYMLGVVRRNYPNTLRGAYGESCGVRGAGSDALPRREGRLVVVAA